MNKQFFDYLRHLSKQDRKTLSQKALKLFEEGGELARVILPFDGAFATNHRFTTKEAILEEVVDTVFCALSVAYHLDCTDDELELMMNIKAEKWARLQANEKDLKYPVPYEIHVTVQIESQDQWIDLFKSTCDLAGVKPIVLDLINNKETIKDAMTSSKHFGDNRSAYEAMKKISLQLIAAGFVIVREKIETVPWHPAAPQNLLDLMPKDCYFESHIPVRLDEKYINILTSRCKEMNLHLSKNAFKAHEDGTRTFMATYRTYGGSVELFQDYVKLAIDFIQDESYTVGNPMNEFSVYDTKVSHDASWLKGN
jgi:NTP pyrophosphatase (non-canonical NTP hydrolase)